MVIRRELAEKYPWIALNLYKAFDDANAIADAERMEHVRYYLDTGLLPADTAGRPSRPAEPNDARRPWTPLALMLLAQFMGQMNSPLQNFIGLLDSPLQELTRLFQSLLSELPGLVEARAKQLESA